MKLTPDNDAPTIPKATKYHGEDLLAKKKELLLPSLDVILAIPTKRIK